MDGTAPFQASDEPIQATRTYRPVPIPPRGEIVAWVFTLILTALNGILLWRGGPLPWWGPLFAMLAFLLALSIRFSRWLEANSTIVTSPDRIVYSSPIRKVELDWDDITRIVAEPVGDGWRVYIYAQAGGFQYQTERIMRGMRGAEVRTGFPHGEEILRSALRMADLDKAARDESEWTWVRH